MLRWNHSFKVEAIHGEKFVTRAEAKLQVFDYIDVYTQRIRRSREGGNPGVGLDGSPPTRG